jgi:hypothetical protein
MGAGYLNDIPIEDFAAQGAAVHLVDWMTDVPQQAYLRDMVRLVEQEYICLVCRYAKNPNDYCRNFNKDDRARAALGNDVETSEVCDNFEADTENPPHCRAYQPGIYPIFHNADVTQGRGVEFAEKLPQLLAGTKTPRKSFSKAAARIKSIKSGDGIEVEDGSVDFITSAMVASQFDFEPFGYFLSSVVDKFGEKSVLSEAKVLGPWEIDLRNAIFRLLMEGHCLEMIRLLSPGGMVYFSIETAHKEKGATAWFQPETVPTTLEMIGRYFDFDLDMMPEITAPEVAGAVGGGSSLIQSYLLRPKSN